MPEFTGIPDEAIAQLVAHYQRRVDEELPLRQRLCMLGGALSVWTHYFLTDPNVTWEERELLIDHLRLTGIDPFWNEIITQCDRSSAKLRRRFVSDGVLRVRASNRHNDAPVLVRSESPHIGPITVPVIRILSVLEGMNTVLRSIAEGLTHITCFVGTIPHTKPQPECESHALYDVIVAWRRGHLGTSAAVTVLRFYIETFSNARHLLETRFGPEWEPKAQKIVLPSLGHPVS